MEPFDCQCGSSNCRGKISGQAGNSLNLREQNLSRLNHLLTPKS
jgi:hypothetical protein